MNRRSLLSAIFAAGVAPAIASAGVLMPVREVFRPKPSIIVGPGVTNAELYAAFDAADVVLLRAGLYSFVESNPFLMPSNKWLVGAPGEQAVISCPGAASMSVGAIVTNMAGDLPTKKRIAEEGMRYYQDLIEQAHPGEKLPLMDDDFDSWAALAGGPYSHRYASCESMEKA